MTLLAVLRALQEIARTLESSSGAEGRIARALGLLRDLVPCERCALLDVSATPDRTFALPVPSPDERPLLERKLKGLWRLITDDEEPLGELEPVAAPRAHLALPVIAVDRIAGVLFLERTSDEPFGEDSVRILSLVAAQLGAYVSAVTPPPPG
jgi:hypothetical protein